MNIQKTNLNLQNVSFKGHRKTIDKTGYEEHKFYYLYDSNKYNCSVEIYNIDKDTKGNLSIKNDSKPVLECNLSGPYIDVDMSEHPEVDTELGFAYRFKLTDKNDSSKVSYAFDNGTVVGIFDVNNRNNKYNVVLSNRATINKNGPMQLIMPDGFNPLLKSVDEAERPSFAESLKAKMLVPVRTHANKLGGTFDGIIQRLPQLESEGVKRIVGTPFTKDDISSHKYWTENAYDVSSDFGTKEDFKNLQIELFKHGINWIADAALVNEGFGGIHMSEFLRKGQGSFSKDMFRADERVSLGILPDKNDFTRMKTINAPFIIKDDGTLELSNPNYDASKPTYIQFYDERLASEEQVKSDSPNRMKTYDKKNTDNIYDITKHDDAVYPFPVEVSPSELTRNAIRIAKKEGVINLKDVETIKNLTEFSTFNVVNKSAAAGLEVWDGNVDIAKLNFYRCIADDSRFDKLPEHVQEDAVADFDRGALAVREYAINSGKYWTQLTADTQLEYVAQAFADTGSQTPEEYLFAMHKLVNDGKLPRSTSDVVDVEIIKNVLEDNYFLRRLDEADMRSDINTTDTGNSYRLPEYILRKSMDVPLETIPYATNLLGILTSPYIAKKPNTEEELGVSRYDIFRAGNPELPEKYAEVYKQADKLYEDHIVPFIMSIIQDIPEIKKDGIVTDFGKYVLSEVVPALTQYAFVKAIDPNAEINFSEKTGLFDFSDIDSEQLTMQSIGIPYEGKTSKEEAEILVNVLKNGIKNLMSMDNSALKKYVEEKYSERSLDDYRIAEMIVDRTESGLGWRIDASKDIASIDAVRSGAEKMPNAWNNVISFWKDYNQSVLSVNPHAYTTAEITDLWELFEHADKSIYTSDGDAERKFIEETGITSIANYNYFFSLLPEMFGQLNVGGYKNGRACSDSDNYLNNAELRTKLDEGWSGTNPGFLFQSPADGVVNSYTFNGNHDKPRLLHTLALDMELFLSDFSRDDHKAKAAKCLMEKDIKSIDFDSINAKAIAMGSRIGDVFEQLGNYNGNDENIKEMSQTVVANSQYIKEAIKDLVNGSYKGSDFDADAFGTRPFDIAIDSVFEQMAHNGRKLRPEVVEQLKAKVLNMILEPAFDRYYSIYKLLNLLPGSPTDFAGDKVAATGFETKAKNYHQQNRNIIHWEWLNSTDKNNPYYFVKEFNEKMNELSALRSRERFSALNDGDTITLPFVHKELVEVEENGVKTKKLKDVQNKYVQSFLRYNDRDSVVIVINDISGVDTPYDKNMNRTITTVPKLVFNPSSGITAKQSLVQGLKVGTIFKNANDKDTSSYVVQQDADGTYYLQRKVPDVNGVPQDCDIQIKPEDYNSLVLYKIG